MSEENRMAEMFRFLTGILEKEEQRLWKVLAAVDFISPLIDLFSFFVMNCAFSGCVCRCCREVILCVL